MSCRTGRNVHTSSLCKDAQDLVRAQQVGYAAKSSSSARRGSLRLKMGTVRSVAKCFLREFSWPPWHPENKQTKRNLLWVASPVCDSYVRPETLVRICDECNFGTYGRCIICGSPGEETSFLLPSPDSSPVPLSVPLPRLSAHTRWPFISFQGSPAPIIVPSAHAWRKTVMVVRKLSTLVASRVDLFYERRRLGEFVRACSYPSKYL
jgi:hypothetical protein